MEQQLDQQGQAPLLAEYEEAVDELDCWIAHLTNDHPEQSADSAQLCDLSPAEQVGGVPFFGANINTKRSGMSFVTEEEYDDPSSARSTGSAVELGCLFGQSHPLGFSSKTALFSGQSDYTSSSQLCLSPCTAANNSSTESRFGLYGASTAQLEVHQAPAMAAAWRSPQQCSMGVPAQVQQQLWASGASAQGSGCAKRKKHSGSACDGDDDDEFGNDADDDDDADDEKDLDFNPYQGVSWQPLLRLCWHPVPLHSQPCMQCPSTACGGQTVLAACMPCAGTAAACTSSGCWF
jgi:hypothetical protein